MIEPRVRFRPVAADDGALIHALHGDPATNVHNPYGASPDRTASEATLAGWLEHRRLQGFGYEIALLDEPIGICGARRDRWLDRDVVNLYWRLLPEYQGRGLAIHLGRHALGVARRAARPHELVVARIVAANEPSRRVAERLGLTRRPELDAHRDEADWILYG